MNRLQSYYEQLQLPIKALIFGSAFIAFGSLLTNPYIIEIFNFDNPTVVMVANVALYGGGIILSYFPLLIFVKLLSHRVNEPNVVITGVAAYLIFLIVMMLLSTQSAEPAAYNPFIRFSVGNQEYKIFRTGVFGVGAVFLWIRYIYRTQKRAKSLAQSYLDQESTRFLNAVFGAIVIGVLFSFIWPRVVDSLYQFMRFVSSDSSNPMSLFAYGLVERLLTLGNLENIIHQEMWFGELGGAWLNSNNQTFTGDVSIWAAQLAEETNVLGLGGAGRYTTGYYVLNLFAVPGYLIAMFTLITNKQIKTRNLFLFIGLIVFSWLTGILLPIELLMLFTAPVLYIFHLFTTSLVYAVLGGLSVNIGFSYLGNLMFSTPGNIIDLMGLVQNSAVFAKLSNSLMILVLIGILTFFAYFAMTRFYFGKMAIDPLNISDKDERVNDFAERLGGLENIDSISNTPMHIYIRLFDRDKLNVAGLHRQGVTRIVETRNGFILSFGASSYMMQKEIQKQRAQLPPAEVAEEEEL